VEPTQKQADRRRIAAWEAEVEFWRIRATKAEAEVAELKAQAARLAEQVAKLSKNSSNRPNHPPATW
jgi:chromosome segregation ATPase